ncbi:hypothetical protein M0802_013621 [Mischocyttarus mexicanus]|nr:hypothetical protein M0802_013621 [Mischocyttarus mexicanus]
MSGSRDLAIVVDRRAKPSSQCFRLYIDMQTSVMPPPWQTVTSSRHEHAFYSNKRARIEEDSVSRLEKLI